MAAAACTVLEEQTGLPVVGFCLMWKMLLLKAAHLGLETAQEDRSAVGKGGQAGQMLFCNMLIWSKCCGSQRQRTACQRQ